MKTIARRGACRRCLDGGAGGFIRLPCTAAADRPHPRTDPGGGRLDAHRQGGRGGDLKVKLADNVAVFGVVKASLADIKPGAFIGVGATPQADGSQRAIQIMIFADVQRGTGEGHRPWDRPNTTMTNATVEQTVAGVDGQVVTVKYKDGEKKIIVPPDAVIRAYMVGSKDELKPGANIMIVRATKQPDGTFGADRVNVGRDGIEP